MNLEKTALTALKRTIVGVNGVEPENSGVNGVDPEKIGVNGVEPEKERC